jgi:sulfatase modifying factor 1
MVRKISLNILALALIVMFWGCGGGGGPQGQLVGNTVRVNNTSNVPIGMAWVPSGVMHMGSSDQDIKGGYDNRNRTVQMVGFFYGCNRDYEF